MKVLAIKTDSGEWVLDVLGLPYGGPNRGRDTQGEFFSSRTKFHLDKFPSPPVVHYHGFDDKNRPASAPEYIGRAEAPTVKDDGVWWRVVLDKASQTARRIWEAAQKGLVRASTGSAVHLVRYGADGHIDEWPVIELSLMDTSRGHNPANSYAVALPAAKAIYSDHGLKWPDDMPEPEADAEGDKQRADAGTATRNEAQSVKGTYKMETLTKEEVAKLVADAVKADRETREAEQKAKEEQQAAIKAAVEEERQKWEQEQAAQNRLPGGGNSAPYAAKFANLWKYDHLEPADQAVMVGILQEAQRSGRSRHGVSEDALKALIVKVGESKDDHYGAARNALKATGFQHSGDVAAKANELNQSTLASYGDEWIGVAYSTELWRKIAQDTPVVGRIPTVVVPQGMESITIPLESTAPTFYKVAQASAQDSNPGPITRTVPTSRMGTANRSLTVAKMGAAAYFTGELEEDSLIPWVSELRMSMEREGAEVLEHVVIDGDTATGATTNINDIGGTPAGNEAFLLFNGFRKLALVTNTANSRSAGVFTVEDFLETVKLMGLGGKNAMNKDQVAFVLDLWTHWKSMELSEVKTRDVFVAPTIENGDLTSIYGYDVIATANMHRANQDATYGLKANTAGKVNLDTASANTTGSLLAVRWDQWRLGYKRRITFETTRVPSADATEIVALMRVGLINRDNEAAAISYGVTL
ncbi:hypothetical protein GC175_17075 [bacterium]|nr:hypothetical protein [bacterium]